VDGSSPLVQNVVWQSIDEGRPNPCGGPCTKATLTPVDNFTLSADPFTPASTTALTTPLVTYMQELPYLSARFDIWDPHSGLRTVDVGLGTNRGGTDLLPPVVLPVTQRNVSIFLADGSVPIHRYMYVRVHGYDLAGWEMMNTSNAIYLDPTPYAEGVFELLSCVCCSPNKRVYDTVAFAGLLVTLAMHCKETRTLKLCSYSDLRSSLPPRRWVFHSVAFSLTWSRRAAATSSQLRT